MSIAAKYRVVKAYPRAQATVIDDEMADLDLRCKECGRYLFLMADADDPHRYVAAVKVSMSITSRSHVNALYRQVRYGFDKSCL